MYQKINYVITTWSGPRRAPDLNYLKNHLLKLLNLKHNLSQITIVKPICTGINPTYYEVETLLSQFDCEIKILEKHDNLGQSYGQFFHAFQTYGKEFDYYIFVEDDYIPNIDNFEMLLLSEYKSQDVKGYLCSYCGIHPDYPKGACSVSNGMISTEYFEKIYTYFPNPISSINDSKNYMCHYNFVKLLRDCDYEIKDFSRDYRVPYYGDNEIIEYGRTDIEQSIFVPHQLFKLDFGFEEMKLDDLPKFLEIRNQSTEFLHNDTNFTLDNTIKWFKDEKPLFYTIKLGDKMIGYFRTSNLENDSIYIGCDIDPSFRGYKLGQMVYNDFMPIIYDKFNLKNIKLEVLSTNSRAIHLYNKLGFIQIGVSPEKIIRNGLEIDSIIMQHTR
jgi:RimJ/RimL family protein N-acetyltransferase